MSDGGNYSSNQACNQQALRSYQPEGHGASIVLNLSGCGVYHNQSGHSQQVLIRSYKDGMRVGCTFITNEALERIIEFHRRYINRTDYEQHQAGY